MILYALWMKKSSHDSENQVLRPFESLLIKLSNVLCCVVWCGVIKSSANLILSEMQDGDGISSDGDLAASSNDLDIQIIVLSRS